MAQPIDTLTDKEKETLRLIVRGHDAKSAANALDLSVHTINERLRVARRKLDVTSSREAARVLLDNEQEPPQNIVYEGLGDAPSASLPDTPPTTKPGRTKALWIGGSVMMFTLATAVAFALIGSNAEAPPSTAPASPSASAIQDVALDQLDPRARAWLAIIDKGNWTEGYNATDTAFRQALPMAQFAQTMETTRAPLGRIKGREFLQYGSVNAPPNAYRIVQFSTDFENRKDVLETVTFREVDGGFAVSGYFIANDDSGQTAQSDAQSEAVARQWLALVDASDWQASYDAAGKTFRDPNTVATWKAASEQVRLPLGELRRRELVTVNEIASPEGYRVVQFRSDFARRDGVIESITLQTEGGKWRVAGYYIQ
jgi:DNA-binding CsgD family transcriptional regulator